MPARETGRQECHAAWQWSQEGTRALAGGRPCIVRCPQRLLRERLSLGWQPRSPLWPGRSGAQATRSAEQLSRECASLGCGDGVGALCPGTHPQRRGARLPGWDVLSRCSAPHAGPPGAPGPPHADRQGFSLSSGHRSLSPALRRLPLPPRTGDKPGVFTTLVFTVVGDLVT